MTARKGKGHCRCKLEIHIQVNGKIARSMAEDYTSLAMMIIMKESLCRE